MARQPRLDVQDQVYHVINRSNARWKIFKTEKDFAAILIALEETLEIIPIDIFCFCIMSNHWHFVAKPKESGDLGRFFGKFTQRVTQRWHTFHHTVGSGHLFQGRFKPFLVEKDAYFIQLAKYVEANAKRAKLVKKAEDWKWSSLYLRLNDKKFAEKILKPWPIDIPSNYLTLVNKPLPKAELENIRNSVNKSKPLGNEIWVKKQVDKYDLKFTLRSAGRPKLN